jgi:starch phosphorylase
VDDHGTWDAVAHIPDQELWHVHCARKTQLIDFVRERLRQQFLRHGEGPQRLAQAARALNPHTLTLGFARRFATYKRASLIFHDINRLKRLLDDPDRPIQIIFSGKAHPADEPGKALIQQVYTLSQQPEFMGKVVFVENYDMNVARHLVAGVDVWLNTPRRPREASGTSGQKASLNGIPNFSVLDGWWAEGYDGKNGWAIGEEREYKDEATQDEADAYSLYQVLEDEIIPLFYERNAAGVPERWVSVMKHAIQTGGPHFNMRRMVIDYTEQYYVPAHDTGVGYRSDNYALAREINAWKTKLYGRWANVRIERSPLPDTPITVGDDLPLRAKVWLDGLSSDEVVVEAVYGMQDVHGNLASTSTIPLFQDGSDEDAVVYKGDFTPSTSGPFAIGIRVRPRHPALIQPILPGLIHWA